MKRLNFGSGEDYQDGWVNLDFADVKTDVKHDLNVFPYPFKDNTFDLIFSSHVLEHLDNPFKTMLELHRILKKGGELEIRVPHFSHFSSLGFNHKNKFCLSDFQTFCNPSIYAPEFKYYSKKPLFEIVSRKLYYQRVDNGFTFLVKRNTYYYFAKVITLLANLSPSLCERIWCYWVGGFNEMRVTLIKR